MTHAYPRGREGKTSCTGKLFRLSEFEFKEQVSFFGLPRDACPCCLRRRILGNRFSYGLQTYLRTSACNRSDIFIWSLTVVCRPPAFGKLHVGEYCPERGIFRAAGIDAETNFILCVKEMADAHLMKDTPVFRTFDAEVVFSAAQTVPHGLYSCGNFGGGPVGISSIRDDAAEMLKKLVFILDGSLSQFSLFRYSTTPH